MRRCACLLVVILLILGAGIQSVKRVQAEFVASTVSAGVEVSADSCIDWNKTYGGIGSDFALALVQTTDGGYALAGRTYSFGSGSSDIWLVKTDASGNHLWNRTYGGTRDDRTSTLVQTSDGGFATVGTTYSFGSGSSDIWLVKTDASGNHLWNRTYGGTREDDPAHFIVQTVDGGYALAGRTYSFGSGSSDIWLVKTDASGNHLWNRTYGGTNLDGVFAFVQTVDGGYALAGHTYSFGAGNCDFWLIKTDSVGDMVWNRTYGGIGEDRAYALIQTVDEGYALVGETLSFGAGESDVWLVRTDALGNHLWNRTYGGMNVDGVFAFVQTVDGGYALAGHTYSFGSGSSDAWLVKISADGNHEWNETYGGIDEDYACRLVPTGNDGFVLVGGTKSFGAGSDDFWLVKTRGPESRITVPDDYSTIQEAINNAVGGDTVFVKAGTYYEHVVVNKTISLVGEDVSTAIIDGNGTGRVASIVSDNVTLTGFTVQRGGGTMFPDCDAGVSMRNVRGCILSGNNIVDNGCFGLHIGESEENTITANSFTRNTWYAIDLTTSNSNTISSNTLIFNGNIGIGMHYSSQQNIISGNMILNNTYGIDAARSSNNIILDNYVANNSRTGMWIQDYSVNNTILGNTVTGSSCCIRIEEQANNNTVSGNVITSGQLGIQILNATCTEICDNTIAHNHGSDEWDAGLRLESADHTQIHDNEITDNWRGIVLYSSSPYVSIYENNVTKNEYGFRVAMGGSNYVNITGNYVANNRGYGIDVTGFGGLGESSYATIARNLIVNNTFEAVGLGIGSNYNMVVQNDMIGNGHAGVTLERYSNYNTVVQNNIIGNAYGICFDLYAVNSTQNTIINNNIINNTQQVRIAPGSVNAWNGSYAAGGNYWNDYCGLDQFSGAYQNLTGGDGIGDTPLVIDGNNIDHYPLMKPWTEAPSLIGDVNADGKVDMKDVGYVARRFMCVLGDPLWDLAVDFNNDEKIDMVDIRTVARHFGERI